ncbi:interferon-induced protein 44 [Danio aesculapii]|uniref:interferon-induced protein 44 n=1 Tax=Danio aesculapii TaxID=1142201 RepID=UPI0024C0246C|nr:interferon-induced protein 44 [Danio aesculapii]
MGATTSEPAPTLELEKPWRKFNWGQKEELKKRLEEFSVSHPNVTCIKILVAGQIGAGKSSFINSVNNTFQGRITSSALVDACGGTSFTKELKAHRVRGAKGDLPFYLSDIMGLEPKTLAGTQPEDVIKTIHGYVKDEYKFNPEMSISDKNQDYVTDPLLSDQAFCLVYVVDANTVQYIDHGLIDKLKTIRHAISKDRIPQVLIMTKVDEACPLVREDLRKIYTSKKIKEKMEMCSDAIGVPKNFIFPVKNYCDEIDVDDDVDVLILKAFDQIVNLANDRLRDRASE